MESELYYSNNQVHDNIYFHNIRYMTDIIFHKSSKYIKDDIDYYASDVRDKHGAIKPGSNIKSYILDSYEFDNSKELPSIYIPFEKNSIDRIYLGISFPLYANNWGAEFLRYLLYVIKKDGSVILPVYPERQGVEKNYWSRSSLEVAFQSRQKWWGMSNIWAENDGVMSMRIGKKEPKIRTSTFTYFIEKMIPEISNQLDSNELAEEIRLHNNNMRLSAVVEKIILDIHGRNKKINIAEINNNGLLAMELLSSDYMNVNASKVYSYDEQLCIKYSSFLPKSKKNSFDISIYNKNDLNIQKVHNVIIINQNDFKIDDSNIMQICLKALNDDGFIIVINDSALSNEFTYTDHSKTVGTKLINNYDIPHYSDLIFDELKEENDNRDSAIKVILKKDNV